MQSRSRSDLVCTQLKTQLLVGEFRLNERLGEERLATTYRVSRTRCERRCSVSPPKASWPATARAAGVPLVPDVQRMRELYEVRRALELAGLDRPSHTGQVHDRSVLEPLRDEWRALSIEEPVPDPEFVLLDETFHVRLITSQCIPARRSVLDSS